MFQIFVIFSIFFVGPSGIKAAQECARREISENMIVCVCNSTYCDTVDPLTEIPSGQYITYVTSRSGLRLEKSTGELSSISTGNYELKVNESVSYQSIIGFGGSFTDAFGINYLSLSESTRENLMRSYFSKEGSEYNLCRVPIGGTDFATHGYSYDDTVDNVEDLSLSNFSLVDEDYTYKIPLIKLAQDLAEEEIKLICSAWTAPKWMKSSKEYAGFLGYVKPEYHQVWADYHLKFLESYRAEDIEFWGMTTGNEPSLGIYFGNKIPTNFWWPQNMRDWIVENFGPTIRNSEFSNIKLMAIDDQVFLFPWLPQYILGNETAANYIDGFGFHWYWSLFFGRNFLSRNFEAFPNKFMISTEACAGSYLVTPSVILGSWLRGTLYAIDIIDTLNRHVSGWIDWNMGLNTEGGPTYINNTVDSPIIVNSSADEFYKNPLYYALVHFSKFIPRDSVRIHIEGNRSELDSIAFKRPDNYITVVLINRNGSNNVSVSIRDSKGGRINLEVEQYSFTTVVYNPQGFVIEEQEVTTNGIITDESTEAIATTTEATSSTNGLLPLSLVCIFSIVLTRIIYTE